MAPYLVGACPALGWHALDMTLALRLQKSSAVRGVLLPAVASMCGISWGAEKSDCLRHMFRGPPRHQGGVSDRRGFWYM